MCVCSHLVGGLLAGSLAVATDATHMASDLAGFLISLFAIWLSHKPATRRLSFGFYRAGTSRHRISYRLVLAVLTFFVLD